MVSVSKLRAISSVPVIIGVFFLLLILLLKSPVLSTPYYWDAAARMVDVMWLKNHGFNPFLGILGQGRPPLFLELMAVTWSVLGHSIRISRLVVILFSFLGAYFTYRLGRYLFDELTGVLAALLLIFSPLYFAQSGIENFEIPLTALTAMAIYFALKSNTVAYLASGISLVLTKEAGVLAIPPIVLYSQKMRQASAKLGTILLFSVPIFSLLIWFMLCKFYFGWYLYPYHTSLFYLNAFSIGARFVANMLQLFFSNYQWVLTGFVLISFISLDGIRSSKLNKRNVALGLAAGTVIFLVLSNVQSIISYLISNIHVIKSSVRSGNIARSLGRELFAYRLVIGSLVFVSLSLKQHFRASRWLNHSFAIILLVILSYLGFFSIYAVSLPRYLLPAYPFFFILGLGFARSVLKKPSLLVILTVLLLFAFMRGWTGNRRDVDGANLESNLEYLDLISTHKSAATYIEKYYPEATVLTSSIMFYELRYPFLGYVDKPIRVEVTYTLHEELNYSPFSKRSKRENTFGFNPDNADLVYFSPEAGQPYVSELLEMMSKLDLKLLRRFEKNGKRAEIYRVNKPLFSAEACGG